MRESTLAIPRIMYTKRSWGEAELFTADKIRVATVYPSLAAGGLETGILLLPSMISVMELAELAMPDSFEKTELTRVLDACIGKGELYETMRSQNESMASVTNRENIKTGALSVKYVLGDLPHWLYGKYREVLRKELRYIARCTFGAAVEIKIEFEGSYWNSMEVTMEGGTVYEQRPYLKEVIGFVRADYLKDIKDAEEAEKNG